jgi:hypothetical protein
MPSTRRKIVCKVSIAALQENFIRLGGRHSDVIPGFFADDIARVFGKETTEYIADLLNGKIDYLPRLPSKILLNIVQYLYLEDLYNLCLSSRQLSKVSQK